MNYFKKLEKLVNTIKKFKVKKYLTILILTLLFNTPCFSLTTEVQKEIYIGCYSNSNQYIGPERAKEYCSCTIAMLDKKFSDNEIQELFKKKPEEIIEKTQFAATHCEKNQKAF